MANDYIPRPDAQFHARRNNFVTYVNGHRTDLGLVGRRDEGRDLGPGSVGVSPAEQGPAADRPPPGWPPQRTQSCDEGRAEIGGCPQLLVPSYCPVIVEQS